MNEAEVVEIKRIINDPNSGVVAFACKAVLEYIDSVEKSEAKRQSKG